MKQTFEEIARDLTEIQSLLREAYDHYFATSDGYCKSGEGTVTLDFRTYFERRDGNTNPRVCVYSYVLGPSRNHYFDSTGDALAAVREWHALEMAETREYA